MSHLLSKSQINQESARKLQSLGHYCSVIHCSYYSSVQLMKHYLLTKLGIDDTQIEQERVNRSPATGRKIGVHECIIGIVKDNITDYREKRNFNTRISTLKAFRVDSDYKNITIFADKGQNSVNLCSEINHELKKML